MNLALGLRALALLAFVAASTAVIVKPELLGAAKATPGLLIPVVAIGRN